MKGFFYNFGEKRFRAGIRILTFFLIFSGFAIPVGIISGESDLILHILIVPAFIAAAWLSVRYIDKRSMGGIGLKVNKPWLGEFWVGIAMALLAQSVIFLAGWMLGWFEITGYGWEWGDGSGWGLAFLTYFIQMLGVGFYEELVFRGYTIRNMAEGLTIGRNSPRKGAIWAVAITSIAFGAAHMANPNASMISTWNIVGAGFLLAAPYLLTGRLALSIGIHFSWNFVMGGVYGLRVSGLDFHYGILNVREAGPDIWTGGAFGPEAGILGIIAMILIFGMILLYEYFRKGSISLDESFLKSYEAQQLSSDGEE